MNGIFCLHKLTIYLRCLNLIDSVHLHQVDKVTSPFKVETLLHDVLKPEINYLIMITAAGLSSGYSVM